MIPSGIRGPTLTDPAITPPDPHNKSDFSRPEIGVHYKLPDQLEDAEKLWRKAHAIFEQLVAENPYDFTSVSYLSNCSLNLAHSTEHKQQLTHAEGFLRQSIALRKQLCERFPSIPDYRRDLSQAYERLTTFLTKRKRFEEARQAGQLSVDLIEQLTSRFPSNTEYLERASAACSALGDVYFGQRQYNKALPLANRMIEFQRKAVQAKPLDYQTRATLCHRYMSMENLQKTSRRLPEAEETLRQVVLECKNLNADFPAVDGTRESYVHAQYRLADLRVELGRHMEAETVHREVIAYTTKLAVDDRGNAQLQHQAGETRRSFASFLFHRCKMEEASQASAEALPYLEKAAELDPSSKSFAEGLLRGYSDRASALILAGDQTRLDGARVQALLAKCLKLDPSFGPAYLVLGQNNWYSGRILEAVSALEKSLTLNAMSDSEKAEAWLFLAMAYRHLGDASRSFVCFLAGVQWEEQRESAYFCRLRAQAAAIVGLVGDVKNLKPSEPERP